jgi:hypothetical protein
MKTSYAILFSSFTLAFTADKTKKQESNSCQFRLLLVYSTGRDKILKARKNGYNLSRDIHTPRTLPFLTSSERRAE